MATLLYRGVLIRLRGMAISEVIATFGIGQAMLELFRYLGFIGFQYTLPVLVDGSLLIGSVYLDLQRVCIVAFSAVLTGALWAFTHHTRTGLAFRGIALAVPLYWKKVLVSTAIFGMLAISWDLLVCTGLVSLGQALFFGVGAYIAGALNHARGWPLWLTIPVATLGGGLLCTLLLVPVLRLRGIYFAVVTLILPLIGVRIIEATKIPGGTEGLSGLETFHAIGEELAVSLLAFLGALFGLRRLMGTDYGLVLQGIRDNDRAVISAGINLYWFKAQALFLASAVGAFAGAFMTHAYGFVGMPVFALDYSILPIAAAVVGGMGSLAGAALGAFILVPVSEALRALGALRIVLYGLFLAVFTVALPEGILHYLERKYHQFERWTKVEA